MSQPQTAFIHLKFQIHGKTDAQLAKLLKPLEDKHPPIKAIAKDPYYLAIMRYLVYLFDPGTDLNREHPRLEDRRNAASKLSGLAKVTDIPRSNEILMHTSGDILDVIQVLLSEVYWGRDYREWQTLNKELDELTNARWATIQAKGELTPQANTQSKASLEALNIKSKLREDCKRINELIDELDRRLWGDHGGIKETAYRSRYATPELFSRVKTG